MWGGQRGIFVLQALAYVGDVVLVYALVISAGGSRRAAILAALAIAVHPYLVFNIKRIVDNNLAIPALPLVTLVVAWVWRGRAQGWRGALLAGLATGCASLTRSNFAPILLLAAGAFVAREDWKLGVLAAAIAIAAVGATNRLASGHWRLSPSSGGYNFYIGANAFTAEALLRYYNPEQSLAAAAAADKIDFKGIASYTFANSHEALFWRLGLDYVARHPLEYLWLGVLKLITLLRPDYRQVYSSLTASALILIVVQTLLALIFPVWLAVRIMLRRDIGAFDGIWAIPVVAILMTAVFLVIGDPRFRLPVEVMAIVDTIWCWDVRRTRAT